MQSFFFWLSVAAGSGALFAQITNPGILEIAIVVALANVAFYAFRRLSFGRHPLATE